MTRRQLEPTVNPGGMRYRVALQQATIARDSDGAEQKTWQDVAVIQAEIDFGDGREYQAAKVVYADVTHVVTIYTYPGLDTTWRIKFCDTGGDKFFDIRGVKPLGNMRRWQRLACRELVGREVNS